MQAASDYPPKVVVVFATPQGDPRRTPSQMHRFRPLATLSRSFANQGHAPLLLLTLLLFCPPLLLTLTALLLL